MIVSDGDGILFNGLWFQRDKKTGYYLNSTIHERLHRYVYRTCVGEIPEGYDVHHRDHDKTNNDISKLVIMRRSEHLKLHGKELTDEDRQRLRDNMNKNARPAACEWHRSKEGRAWHREHAKFCARMHEKVKKVCKCCSREFIGPHNQMFCSNNCKSKWRRNQKIDDVEVTCCICGKTVSINKYQLNKDKQYTCKGSCTNYFWHAKKKT